MRGPQPPAIALTDEEREGLEALVRRRGAPQQVALRARLILAAAGRKNAQVARHEGVAVEAALRRRGRWLGLRPIALADLRVADRPEDAPRSGAPARITVEQVCRIVALACEAPDQSGRPISQWTGRAVADEVIARGSVPAISPRHVGRLLNRGIASRPWLTPPEGEGRAAQVADVHALYRAAPALAARGERIMSTDELTGVQALERRHPGLPPLPGKVERREFESVRHGTRTCIVNRDVATGAVVAPSCGPTRTAADCLAHIRRTVATDPAATRWHFVVDNLNIHLSGALVRCVAADMGLDADLGEQGQRGILACRASCAAFLSDPSHRLVFHYTPKHSSWLNQIEIWLSILVRKLLRRGSFTAVADLEAKVLAFIAYYNRTMAKPTRWTTSAAV